MNFPPPSDRQARIIWMACTGLALLVIMAVLVVVVWGLGRVLNVLAPVLWPLAIAGVLAYLLDPVVDWFERKGVPRTRAIFLVLFIVAGLFLAVLSSILPRVVVETGRLVDSIPEYTLRIERKLEELLKNPPAPLKQLLSKTFLKAPPNQSGTASETAPPTGQGDVETRQGPGPATGDAGLSVNWDVMEAISKWAAAALPEVGRWTLKQLGRLASWVGVVVSLALVPVYLFYFLLEKKVIAGRWAHYLPIQASGIKEEIVFVIRAINDPLIAFFRGQVLVALCDSVLYTIGFLIIGLDYAFLIGFCAVFLTIIPYIGAFVICASAVLLAFVQFGDPAHGLMPLAVFAVVQVIEGFVLQPRILGDRVGLHPLAIIISVIVGTTLLGGLLGGVLAIPAAAALRVILHRYVWVKAEPGA